ncbi:3-mercaptopyruvate sulfurtransferase [Sphingobium nicotianae]|uniref:Sulfurtransferase n=1 Tax=Sphingobium nicotianae TaxID=2782607 RepID=A0A9X1DFH4_9SPHN|nr:3-mercaptopyruvate sulfurtransferase [Sphingobium nicotianae]MBT2188553.1 3-mercaptopyruvate sulfurtransferase [Sphingobium nicotianae]
MDKLVSTEWLASQLGAQDLRILDATSFLPGTPRDPLAEFREAHIPGAAFLDLSNLKDVDDPRPSMVPTNAQFAAHLGALGVSETDRIIVYDNSPLASSGRAWWLLRLFGARQVAILDGGFARWLTEGRPTESGEGRARPPATFAAAKDERQVRSMADVLDNIESCAAQVVDARGAARFAGEDPEPRADMASGHIPGSVNLPTGQMLDADGLWKRDEAMRETFAKAGVDLDRPLIMSCGSGVTACNLLFGAALIGKDDVTIYDGSWSEWGADPHTPKATGPA